MNLLQCLLSVEDQAYFTGLTHAVCEACRLSHASPEVQAKHPCRLDFDPVKPGGIHAYPAIWTQDFTMIFASGFLPLQVGLDHFQAILRVQNGIEPRRMDTGALVPAWAIPDHVNFDGTPVYFPGTYSSGPDQGGYWGMRPPFNNYFDVIWLGWQLAAQSSAPQEFLRTVINGVSVYERLKHAFAAVATGEDGIVFTTEEERAVGFIFCDSIQMTGDLLMPTLLRRRAAGHLSDLAAILNQSADARFFAAERERARDALASRFQHESGWLRASTGRSSQPDVFGTLYALFSQALTGEPYERSLRALLAALEEGQIEQAGALRHVPRNHDFSADSAWETTKTGHNTYQNGAYWFMPAGWLVEVLYRKDPVMAREYLQRYLGSMRAEDFRDGAGYAPWEWIYEDKRSESCPVFGPSVTLPYAVLSASRHGLA